jgi:ribosomal protein S16
MRTISLNEALELATKGPLKAEAYREGYMTEGPDYTTTYSPCDMEDKPEMAVTNALLAHWYNMGPELVEAVQELLNHSCEEYECSIDHAIMNELKFSCKCRRKLETVLARAQSVTLPE